MREQTNCPQCRILSKYIFLAREAVYQAQWEYDEATKRNAGNGLELRAALTMARADGRVAALALREHIKRDGCSALTGRSSVASQR